MIFALKTKKLTFSKASFIFTATSESDDIITHLDKEHVSRYSDSKFILKILDADGFILFSQDIQFKNTTAIVNKNNRTIGYEYTGDIDAKKVLYKSIADWSVGWSGFKDIPSKTAEEEKVPKQDEHIEEDYEESSETTEESSETTNVIEFNKKCESCYTGKPLYIDTEDKYVYHTIPSIPCFEKYIELKPGVLDYHLKIKWNDNKALIYFLIKTFKIDCDPEVTCDKNIKLKIDYPKIDTCVKNYSWNINDEIYKKFNYKLSLLKNGTSLITKTIVGKKLALYPYSNTQNINDPDLEQYLAQKLKSYYNYRKNDNYLFYYTFEIELSHQEFLSLTDANLQTYHD